VSARANLPKPPFSAKAIALLLLALVVLLFATPSFAAPPEGPEVAPLELDERGHVRVPEPSEQALEYHRSGNLLWVVKSLWALLIPAVLLFSGLSARLRSWASKVGHKRWRAIGLFLLAYVLVTFAVDLPLSYYSTYLRPHAYGLSEQAAGKWVGDQFKGLLLTLIAALLFVPGTLWFIRKSPERWWIWTSMAAIPIAFLLLMLWPVFVAPLYNDFGPMKDASLEAEILALAERAGIEGSRVFEVEKSIDTKTVNAYVTGFLATKRIVLWDTIIARLDRNELLVVMGHEMGHYVLGHVTKSMILIALSIPASLWLFHTLAQRAIMRFGQRFGFHTLDDVAALPLFLLLIGLLGLVAAPLANAWSRHEEHEADRFALEITHDNVGCAGAFAKLQQSNLGVPRPSWFYVLFRASHPTLGDRIDFCNEYRPWETGESEVYANRFSAPGAE
jgi:STE24 endopeptidase